MRPGAQGGPVGLLEVAQALRAGPAGAGVADHLSFDVVLVFRLNIGQLELFTQKCGQLFHGQLYLQDMRAWGVAGFTRRLHLVPLPERVADLSFSLAYPSLCCHQSGR
jgi:hypothetical protein